MSVYAKGTSVSVDKSKSEIERVLRRYDKDVQFGLYSAPNEGGIAFQMSGRSIRVRLPLPKESDFAKTEQGRPRTQAARKTEYDKAVRQRWRALLLIVKAKLEAIESGISQFDDEWLAYLLLPEGKTVGEKIGPELEAARESGRAPVLMLGFGGSKR